jgi:rhodanese-related sulfurtransferase
MSERDDVTSDLTTVRGVFERLGGIQLVDCREPYEWEAGRVEGAIHIPLNDIMAGSGGDLDHEQPVAVICRSGNRSELAAMMLQARGFEAFNVEGGMESWAAEGLPFAAPDGSPGRVA